MNGLLINLTTRPDRLSNFQKQVFPKSWNVEVFSIEPHKEGWKGNLESHLKACKFLYHEGPFVILEDDCEFIPDWIALFQKAVMELPNDWDMLYLGINAQSKFKPYSPHLAKVTNGLTTHAYLINNPNIVVALLEIERNRKKKLLIDQIFAKYIQPVFNCYCTIPILAYQSPGESDIVVGYRDYKKLLATNFKKYVTDGSN